ncbi:MAG: glycosyltransferase family 4 protein [Coriobacteriia bacterium]|nr:glycosyltransferase family 4 protein [Coriobacteriia bacterium]
MRIGFFTDTYTPQINGVVTSIKLFREALEARGHEVIVFAPRPRHAEDGDQTVRFLSVPFFFQRELRVATPVSLHAIQRIEDTELDVVHSHDPFAIGLFGLAIAKGKKIPYIHSYHTLYPEYVHYVWEARWTKRLAEILSRDFCDVCDTIIAPSTKIDHHLRQWGVRAPIEVLPTGIDLSAHAVADNKRALMMRKRLQLAEGERVVTFVGRLGKEKNVGLLIRAMALVKEPLTRLVIVGDGPDRAQLEALVERLRLGPRVSFTGYLDRPDVTCAYRISDAFVFASTTETQGLVVGEAMAAGLPVIAVTDDAVGDFVKQDKNGLLVPPNERAFANAVSQLLADSETMARMGAASRLRASSLSIDIQAAKLESLYQRAIDSYAPPTLLPKSLQVRVDRLLDDGIGRPLIGRQRQKPEND